MLMELLILWSYMLGLLSFLLKSKHLLLLLISLEFMVISLYLSLHFYIYIMDYESFFLMIFLIFGVAEGVLGLGILVMMIRSHGNDLLSTFFLLW